MSDRSPLILLDAQALQGPDPERGIPRWLAEFSRSLRKHRAMCIGLENPVLRPIHRQFIDCFDTIIRNSRSSLRTIADSRRVVYIAGSALEPVRPIRSLLPDHVLDGKIPIITVIHDLALYRYPQFYQIREGDQQTYAARRLAFRWSDHFFCNSRFTANDLVKFWDVPQNRVSIVGTGISDFFTPGGSLNSSGTKPFVLSVGRRDPRKQTSFLIRMFANLPEQIRSQLNLVIVCRLDSETERTWRHLALEVGLNEDQLVLTGLIEDKQLRTLYRTCQVFVEPSLFEGFGLPLAEAAACGAVTICSDSSSLPEILRIRENLFSPTDLPGASALLERSLTDSALRSHVTKAGLRASEIHRWDTVAQKALSVIDELGREVLIPPKCESDYSNLKFPIGALGRTIPLACLDD